MGEALAIGNLRPAVGRLPIATLHMERTFARHFSVRSALAAFAFAIGARVDGQLPQMSGGTRVQVAMTDQTASVNGTVFSQSADTLLVAGDGVVRAIPTGLISTLAVGGGRSHSAGALQGAKFGALILGGVGVGIFGTLAEEHKGDHYMSDLAGVAAASALSGAFYGAIIGAVVGAETWTPVYERRVSLSMPPTRGGRRGLGLSLTF